MNLHWNRLTDTSVEYALECANDSSNELRVKILVPSMCSESALTPMTNTSVECTQVCAKDSSGELRVEILVQLNRH